MLFNRDRPSLAGYLSEILKPLGWEYVGLQYDGYSILFRTPDGIHFIWYPPSLHPNTGECILNDIGDWSLPFLRTRSSDEFISAVMDPGFRKMVALESLRSYFYIAIARQIDDWISKNPILKEALVEYIPREKTEKLAKIVLIGSPTGSDLRSLYTSLQGILRDYDDERNKWFSLILSKLNRGQDED